MFYRRQTPSDQALSVRWIGKLDNCQRPPRPPSALSTAGGAEFDSFAIAYQYRWLGIP